MLLLLVPDVPGNPGAGPGPEGRTEEAIVELWNFVHLSVIIRFYQSQQLNSTETNKIMSIVIHFGRILKLSKSREKMERNKRVNMRPFTLNYINDVLDELFVYLIKCTYNRLFNLDHFVWHCHSDFSETQSVIIAQYQPYQNIDNKSL